LISDFSILISNIVNISSQLKQHIKGKLLIAGIGNTFKGFDGIGVRIARQGKQLHPGKFIDCGTVPENYLGEITSRGIETLIIVDAVHHDRKDDVAVLLPDDLAVQGMSTHSLSLSVVAEYLKNCGIHTVIVGIRPGRDVREEVLSNLFELIDQKQHSS
jgi:hydrogenase maturation protease